MTTETTTPENIQENAKQAAELLKLMSNEYRLQILCHLGEKEMSVGQLNLLISLSQSSLSQHLAKLRADGLVTTRRESQTIYYQIANPITLKIIEVLYQEFCAE